MVDHHPLGLFMYGSAKFQNGYQKSRCTLGSNKQPFIHSPFLQLLVHDSINKLNYVGPHSFSI